MNKFGMKIGIRIVALLIILLIASGAWANSTGTLTVRRSSAAMTADEAAWLFFTACERRDWDEVGNFWPMPINDHFKKYTGGLELLRLGQPSKSLTGPGFFVPYKIRLSNGEVKKYRLSLRHDNNDSRWMVDGGL